MIEDLTAFKTGEADCIKANGIPNNAQNPYEKDSLQWRNWNRGWNNQIDKL